MPFNGNEDHTISLDDAAEYTKRYRHEMQTGDILGSYFGKSFLQSILNQTDCVGIRFYNGFDENMKPRLVIAGVTSDMGDIYNGILGEHSWDCPPFCSKPNPLNS